MLPPGYLSMQAKGYEREKQKTIEQLLIGLRDAGIENPSRFLFASNQQSNAKGTNKRKNKIVREDGDEDYEPFNGEDGLSDDDGNDDFSRPKAKKVKRTAAGKKNGGSIAQAKGSGSHEATQALQLPTSPTEQTDPFCSPHTVVGNVVDEARTTMSKKPTRRRGPTKLKTIAIDGGSRIKVLFNDNGIPIGEGSVKLSSFYGALVKEIVPYTISDWRKLPSSTAEVLWKSIQVRFELDEEWQRQIVFQKMNEVWRAAKSILVKKVIVASNEEERMKLQPPNIKSLHDWKDFVKEKTSANFKGKSDNFKEIRKKQLELQHTMSRKGYARLTAEMAQNVATTEGTPTTPIISPSRVTTNPGSNNCKLLDWMGTGEEVAEGHWSSSDPNELVHHIPLGPNAMRVWVDVPKKPEAFLWRPTSYMETIEEAVGTTIAWPADKVLMDSTPRSMG